MRYHLLFPVILLLATLQLSAQQIRQPIKCLTPYLIDRHGRLERITQPPEALVHRTLSVRMTREKSLVTSNGHFRVHYNTSGPHAVANLDANSNSIPDYIDSVDYYLESAWHVMIDQMGYFPPTDMGIQGPEVDVFISELGGDYYGAAFPEFDNVINTEPLTVTAYLVLDNDYRDYATPGIAGLRVTTAHEFHHIVQVSSYRCDIAQASLYESTSTWMEQQLHPSILDYRNYTDLFLQTPQYFPYSTHEVNNIGTGYGHMLYHDYLIRRLDADVVRKIWEEFAREERSFTAIDNVLKASGSLDLERSWCEFALWCYFTGRRAPADSSLLGEAARLPTMASSQERLLNPGATTILQGELQPLAFVLERVILRRQNNTISDTIDFVITNARSDIGKGGPDLAREPYSLSVSRLPLDGYLPVTRNDSTIAYYSLATAMPHCVRPIVGGRRDATLAVPEPGVYQLPSNSKRRPTLH